MTMALAQIALVVRDYDEAIAYYVQSLRFHLLQDEIMSHEKRWVVLSPSAPDTNSSLKGANILLAKASNEEQISRIGNQTGGRVFLFLHTTEFWNDYNYMKSQGVDFIETPRQEPFGTVVVFRDIYGNKWDLIEKK